MKTNAFFYINPNNYKLAYKAMSETSDNRLRSMSISAEEHGNVILLNVAGPINAIYSPKLREVIAKAFEENAKGVFVDISNVDYMDSSGLATFVEALQKAQDHQGTFALVGEIQGRIKHLFEISRLEGLFDCFSSKEEALASFA